MTTDKLLEQIQVAPSDYLTQCTLPWLETFLAGNLTGHSIGQFPFTPSSRITALTNSLHRQYENLRNYNCFHIVRMMSIDDFQALDLFWEMLGKNDHPESVETFSHNTTTPIASGIEDVLNRIRERPAMFLSHPSLTLLRAYVEGILQAFDDHERPAPESVDFAGFGCWLIETKSLPSNCQWDRIIVSMCDSEQSAFESFFRLLGLYKSEASQMC